MPAIGTRSMPSDVETSPYTSLDERTSGSMLAGTPNRRSSSSSHCSVWMLNSIVRDALLTSVTCARVAGQLPDEPGVHGAERQLAGVGARARARHVVENPADLARGKIGVDEQAGLRLNRVAGAVGLQPLAVVGGAAVLPDDGVVHRLAGLAVPDDRRLALVGDADGGDVLRPDVRAAERLDRDADLRRPDFLRVVLDPAGPRERSA